MLHPTRQSTQKIRRLHIVFIKPSKYDDEGYVMRHFRGVLPSNTLACLYGLTEEVKRQKILGEVEIDITLLDEAIHKIPVAKIIKLDRRKDTKVFVCLAGVQTNQYPRATDLALQFRAAGVTVLIGGFHVSGMLAMFPTIPADIQHLMDCGVTIVKGEVEEHWHEILSDAIHDRLKPMYDFINDLPDLRQPALPMVNKKYLRQFAFPNFGTIDCGRGCPFNCSFCTIINVQGRKVRYRDAHKIAETLRRNHHAGVNFYFFTDDNFARNKNWEAIFDEIIRLRQEEGIAISFMMQVDVLSYKIKNFIDKAKAAGCTQVFIGMESTNPKNLQAAGKTQNHVDDFVNLIAAWHRVGVATHVGFIIGFPFDTEESVREDLRRLMHEIKVDQASFFMLTPLPGSMDHKKMVGAGAYLDPDYNTYDSFHESMQHPHLKNGAWTKLYRECWRSFYSFDNMKAILRRASKETYWNIFKNFIWYKNAALVEGNHPMVAGFFRLKDRTVRRPGYAIATRWAHLKMRVPEIWRYVKGVTNLLFEMQELWLQTRLRPAFEIKVVRELDQAYGRRLKASLQEKLTILEWKRSRVWSGLLSTFNRLNVFALGGRQSRREMTRFWQRAYVYLKSGRWHRISLPRLAANLFREAKLALYFLHSMLAQIKSKEVLRRRRLTSAQTPIAISLGLPNKVGELKTALETFFTELGVKIIPAGQSLESLLEEGHDFIQRQSQHVEKAVSTYLHGLKGKADYVLLPLVNELEQYHQRFLAGIEEMAHEVSSKLKQLPKIINVPLPQTNVEVLRENLLQLGLLFTDDVARVRLAYERAVARETS
ncbi:MAG: radical SAM protein [candidate division KSB1 bacterium]|nr:radical SAM protein [candidate division KSB1 bacterium]MDZ7300520.1 radical SAM protein [candidate division KSB1 bacterium]MDZ7309659.1 radical SAM protein [candidate division KSB1 bacterium]